MVGDKGHKRVRGEGGIVQGLGGRRGVQGLGKKGCRRELGRRAAGVRGAGCGSEVGERGKGRD